MFTKELRALKVQCMLYNTESLFHKVSHIKGRTQAEGVLKWSAEEDIWV